MNKQKFAPKGWHPIWPGNAKSLRDFRLVRVPKHEPDHGWKFDFATSHDHAERFMIGSEYCCDHEGISLLKTLEKKRKEIVQ